MVWTRLPHGDGHVIGWQGNAYNLKITARFVFICCRCFQKRALDRSQFLAEKTLLVSPVTLFSISGYLEQSHPCPARKHTHTDGISAWKRNTKSKWFWSYLLYQYKLSPFSLIHLIVVIFKHNEMITLYYLKFNWNHRVFKWTKRYISIKKIS